MIFIGFPLGVHKFRQRTPRTAFKIFYGDELHTSLARVMFIAPKGSARSGGFIGTDASLTFSNMA